MPTTLNEAEHAQWGETLYNALRARSAIPPIINSRSDLTVDDAYAISLDFLKRREKDGERVIGKKIGVTSKARVPNQPDLPTVGETVPGFEFYSWYGLWGPAKLPDDIRARLNAEVNKALASPELRDKFTPQGLLLTPGSSEDFVRFQRDDMARAQKIITEGNIRVE